MDLEKEARRRAIEHVAKLVQRPDQLERIGEMKKKAERKKAAYEAMLRSGVQEQVEGIRSVLLQLRGAADDVVAFETESTRIRESLKPFAALHEKMTPLREWTSAHDQYAVALDNHRLIVETKQLIANSTAALTEGQLLLVHKNVMDLERARDELMYEVHKLGGPTMEEDTNILKKHFEGVDKLVPLLRKEMDVILKRCLVMKHDAENTQGATNLVSVLRIIEREERIDKYYEDGRIQMKDFMPPGRPRRWRDAAMRTIDSLVWDRVSMSQIDDDRAMSAGWLVKYLEGIRIHMVQDLSMAKGLSATCFPPHYEMYDRFVGMYHSSVQRRLREITETDSNFNQAEIVQLLNWIKQYTDVNLLGNPKLGLNSEAIVTEDPLLPPDVIVRMREKFLELARDYMTNCLARALDREKEDWYKDEEEEKEEKDEDGNFCSPLPQTLGDILKDTLTLVKDFPMDVRPHVIDMAMQLFLQFIVNYRDAAMEFKATHFEDRRIAGPQEDRGFKNFTKSMITAANNMLSCVEITDMYLNQIRLSMKEEGGRGGMRRHDVIEHITKVADALRAGCSSITSVLFEEVILDLNKHLADIFSRSWLEGTADPMGTIVLTIGDFHKDHSHLKSDILLCLGQQFHLKVVGEYLRAIESRRLTFASLSERQDAAKLLKKNEKAIKDIFSAYVSKAKLAKDDAKSANQATQEMEGIKKELEAVMAELEKEGDSTTCNDQFPFLQTILSSIGALLVDDRSLLGIETIRFARKFPNCPVEVLAALLMAREDVNRADAKEMAEDGLSSDRTAKYPRNAAFGELFESSRADASRWGLAPGGIRVADVHAVTRSKIAGMLM